jgi:hypothetical protein
MLTCPFCTKAIQAEVMACPFCGEVLNTPDKPKPQWYFSTAIVVIAFLSVGPLALPLVWFNPRYKIITKIVVSVIVIALTIWFYFILKDLYLRSIEKAKELGII